MPAQTGKIVHNASALKKIIFPQKSQFMFSTIDISMAVWPAMLQLKFNVVPVLSHGISRSGSRVIESKVYYDKRNAIE